jgi:hypothetical protein
MRRSFTGFVVAAATALIPLLSLAGNQEVAEQVAKTLRSSGQMQDYKVGVKCQDGTVWLKGQVTSDEQAKTALALASQVPGVTAVKNELTVATPEPAAAEPATGSRMQFGRSQSNLATPSGRLQASGGVFAPEQISRVASNNMAGSYAGGGLDVASMRRLQQAQAAPAQQVATSFAQVPARQVMATEGQQPTPVLRPAHSVPVAYAPSTLNENQGPSVPAMAAGAVAGPPVALTAAAMSAGGNCPMPAYGGPGAGVAAARYDQPNMPCYAWPSYASYPNYAAVTYPRQYSPTAWPYIGPFYPYPQVPLGWRKVTLEWDDGWWQLDFKN